MASGARARAKFDDPLLTAAGETRASIELGRLDTLWFNTGTLCNIECVNCYIESSPRNDRLEYMTAAEVASYLDEIEAQDLGTGEIGFTGGEPFLNPHFLDMMEDAIRRGYRVLVLTNAMRPMLRPRIRERLVALRALAGERLTLRVSLDHYTAELHDRERGPGAWREALDGVRWLVDNAFRVSVAGRSCWGESELKARRGYAALFATEKFGIAADDPSALVIFPEMDTRVEVPEITVDCWNILDVDPRAMMCASSRMVVKRKGAATPAVLACTLLPYDDGFELGGTLEESRAVVHLNHPHCAKFCVLGGATCSG
jgi:uncharacterized Fe-S cluster-containing radical SAM superfamily protein